MCGSLLILGVPHLPPNQEMDFWPPPLAALVHALVPYAGIWYTGSNLGLLHLVSGCISEARCWLVASLDWSLPTSKGLCTFVLVDALQCMWRWQQVSLDIPHLL